MGQYLGQHFLSDQTVLEDILSVIIQAKGDLDTDVCIEIGPGQGALTHLIAPIFEKLFLLEKDPKMENHLNKYKKNSLVIRGDVLEHNVEIDNGKVLINELNTKYNLSKLLVVGNLPYYITSPIFRKFFTGETLFPGGVFLIQKEVGEKIKTDAKKKSYLWWLINYGYTIEYCFTVDKNAFTPPPNVQSGVVRFVRKTKPHSFTLERLIVFLDIVSRYSRKTLGKIQKMEKSKLEQSGILIPESVYGLRLEQCNWKDVEKILSFS